MKSETVSKNFHTQFQEKSIGLFGILNGFFCPLYYTIGSLSYRDL